MKKYISAMISIFVLVFIDQYTKVLALTYLKDQKPFVIWDGVFELCYLENRGAGFGILQNRQVFFIIMTAIVLIAVMYIYRRTPDTKRYLPLRLTMLLLTAGAIGNMIDRILRGYVVDFFYFSLIDFPIFNVADIYITVTYILLAILLLFYYKDDELEIFSFKKNRLEKGSRQ